MVSRWLRLPYLYLRKYYFYGFDGYNWEPVHYRAKNALFSPSGGRGTSFPPHPAPHLSKLTILPNFPFTNTLNIHLSRVYFSHIP